VNKTKTNTRPARHPTNYALVVGDDDGGRLLGHVAPVLPHGDAHVRALPVCLFVCSFFGWLMFGGSVVVLAVAGRRERCVTDTVPTYIRIQTETYRHTQREARTDTYTSTDTYTGTHRDRQTDRQAHTHRDTQRETDRHAQRRRVVDPIPGHGHHAAAAVQRLDQRHLRRKRQGTACR